MTSIRARDQRGYALTVGTRVGELYGRGSSCRTSSYLLQGCAVLWNYHFR